MGAAVYQAAYACTTPTLDDVSSEDVEHLLVGRQRPQIVGHNAFQRVSGGPHRVHRRQQRLCACAASSSRAVAGVIGSSAFFRSANALTSSAIGVETVLQQRGARLDAGRLQRWRRSAPAPSGNASPRAESTVEPISRVSLASTLTVSAYCSRRDLVAAVHLPLVEHAVLLEKLDSVRLDQLRQRVQRGLEVRQAARRGLDLPVLRVAVAVEHHGAVLGDDAR